MSSCLALPGQPFPTTIVATVFDSQGPRDIKQGPSFAFSASDPAEMEGEFDTFLSETIDSSWGLTNYDRLRLEWSVQGMRRGDNPLSLITDIFDETEGRVVGYVEVLRIAVEAPAAPVLAVAA